VELMPPISTKKQSPLNKDGHQFNQYQQNKQSPLSIGRIVDHLCLEVIVCFVDIGGIDDHLCLEVIVCFVDIGGIDDHLCLEVIVCFVDIGGIVDHLCFINSTNINKTKQSPLSKDGHQCHQYQRKNNHL
jgi:5-methylcytosine-specific restriction endonuclease McrA